MRSRAALNGGEACSNVTARLCVSVLLLLAASAAHAQAPAADPSAQQGMAEDADQNRQLADQITELRAKLAKLQGAVQQTGPGKKLNPRSGMKMSPASDKGMVRMDSKSEMGMPAGSGMSMGSKSNSSLAPAPAMGMCCMGKMASGGNASKSATPSDTGSMAAMSGPSSAMPGQAGASHLYHIGSNGFFLNHSKHITLTPDQTLTLNRVKEKAILDQASDQSRIDQAEQDLYNLTGADQPENAKFEAKIAEIEKLRAGQRMNFIRAVEDASNELMPEQRQALLGNPTATRK